MTTEERERIEKAIAAVTNPRDRFGIGASDEVVLAEAAQQLLDQQLPDDEHRLNAAFLAVSGATQEENPAKWTFHRKNALPIGIWESGDCWKAVVASSEKSSTTIVRNIKTRGQLRRLCAALGIELQENQ